MDSKIKKYLQDYIEAIEKVDDEKIEIKSLDDCIDLYKKIANMNRAEGGDKEWTLAKDALENIFNYDTANKTKNQCYLAFQSLIVNNSYKIFVEAK